MGTKCVTVWHKQCIRNRLLFVFCPTFKEQPDVDRAQYWMNVVQPHIPSVTFSQLVQIFDWNIVKWEQPAIICMLKLLLQELDIPTAWRDTGSKPTMFPVNVLGPLRRAVILQSALLKGTDCFFFDKQSATAA